MSARETILASARKRDWNRNERSNARQVSSTRTDQTRAPFFDSLVSTRQRGPLSFHMPGHKFDPELLPELADFLAQAYSPAT
jgi:hypothetical protein